MTVLLKVSMPARAFRLDQTFERHGAIQVECESAVPLLPTLRPRLWIRGLNSERADVVLRKDSDIRDATVHIRTPSGTLVGVEWRDREMAILRALGRTDATCLRCVGREGSWYLTLRFPGREHLTAFHAELTEHDLPVTVNSPHEGSTGEAECVLDRLTDVQYDTLCTALRRGYFSVPRQITLQQLAEEVGVSDTAASQRIRRGLEAVLAEELRTPIRERPPVQGDT